MRDDLTKNPENPAPPDPSALARRDLAKSHPKRFYNSVSVGPHDGGFALLLDGRVAKTPAKAPLVLPTHAAAEAVAAEWAAQGAEIDFATMPLTRIVHTAIDGVAHRREAVITDTAKYAETDLVCYRAGDPESLANAQAKAWDPILSYAAERLGARFICREGVTFVAQPAQATDTVRAKVEDIGSPFALASLATMTALTGSVLIALALADGAITLDEAWAAAHIDEDFQARRWGEDPEAMARRDRRFAEMAAAERLWRLIAA